MSTGKQENKDRLNNVYGEKATERRVEKHKYASKGWFIESAIDNVSKVQKVIYCDTDGLYLGKKEGVKMKESQIEGHNYILVEVIENYEGITEHGVTFGNKFVGLSYVVGCYTCGKVRTIRQETFDVMAKAGLLEGTDKNVE